MRVERIRNGYIFESPTINGAFVVRLTLTDKGQEKLETLPVGVALSFRPVKLEPGTVEKAVGPDRWQNFVRMKEKGITMMFIDPHRVGEPPYTW